MEIRQLTPSDVAGVLKVQKEAYLPQLLEGVETFLNKMLLFPRGVFGCLVNGELCAYVFYHPWTRDAVVPLDHPIAELPLKPDCMYIHDLAVSPACQGQGIARRLLEQVFTVGDSLGLYTYSLIAVQSSEAFWQRFGFRAVSNLEYVPGVPGTRMILERAKL